MSDNLFSLIFNWLESFSNNKIFCLYEKNSLIDPTAFGPKPSIFDNELISLEAKIKFLIFLNSFAKISEFTSPINLIPKE